MAEDVSDAGHIVVMSASLAVLFWILLVAGGFDSLCALTAVPRRGCQCHRCRCDFYVRRQRDESIVSDLAGHTWMAGAEDAAPMASAQACAQNVARGATMVIRFDLARLVENALMASSRIAATFAVAVAMVKLGEAA